MVSFHKRNTLSSAKVQENAALGIITKSTTQKFYVQINSNLVYTFHRFHSSRYQRHWLLDTALLDHRLS